MTADWTDDELRARIATAPDPQQAGPGVRHEAGSPNQAEVAAYARLLPPRRGTAVVLGMTPELRTLALSAFDAVVAVDRSAAAVELYRSWVGDPDGRERVVVADWADLGDVVAGPVDAVLGDGVIGNVGSIEAAERLLAVVRGVLAPGGAFVTRSAVVPDGVDVAEVSHRALLAAHRAGELDEVELGFGTRLLGHLACCYDPATALLDNARLFAEVRADAGYTGEELAAIERYRFSGTTLLLPERRWLDLTADAGFATTRVRLSGRDWYAYYPLYALAVPEPRP